jgi:hypothetical protein
MTGTKKPDQGSNISAGPQRRNSNGEREREGRK